jgi:hypothetical protein
MLTHAAAAPPLSKFGWFADMVGSCWVGTFPDGKTRHSHCYTTQFDRFIRGTATLAVDGTDKFAGDSVFAWDEKEQRIVYYIWASDGSHRSHEARYAGDELAFPIYSQKDPGKVLYRSVWRRIGADSFQVRREVPEGSGWKTELTVVYRRRPL